MRVGRLMNAAQTVCLSVRQGKLAALARLVPSETARQSGKWRLKAFSFSPINEDYTTGQAPQRERLQVSASVKFTVAQLARCSVQIDRFLSDTSSLLSS